MRSVLAVAIVMLFFACSAPKSVYYFNESSNLKTEARSPSIIESTKGFDSEGALALTDGNSLTASVGKESYQHTTVRLDTGKVPTDSLQKKPNRPLTKEEYKKAYKEKEQLYEERKRAYEEKDAAYKEMRGVRAANKDKRKDIFTVLGAILISVAIVSLIASVSTASLGVLALIVGIPGVIFSIIGLKSRIWGMSVAFLIIAAVAASMALAYAVLYNQTY